MKSALDRDPRAHLRELGDVLKAILVDVLGDDSFALGLRHDRHLLRLQVGRETGVGPCGHVDRLDRSTSSPPDVKPTIAPLPMPAPQPDLEQHYVEVLGTAAFDAQLRAGRSPPDAAARLSRPAQVLLDAAGPEAVAAGPRLARLPEPA